jgi:hypothetical protein
MSFETTSGLGSRNHYGPRSAQEGIEGSIKTEGSVQELSLKFTGANINDDVFATNLAFLPAGARIIRAIVKIDEVFVLGGTSPVINIGTDGSESTNGISIDETRGEAAATYIDSDTGIAINGTWAATLAAKTEVSVALSGTSPTVTSAGSAIVTIQYIKMV